MRKVLVTVLTFALALPAACGGDGTAAGSNTNTGADTDSETETETDSTVASGDVTIEEEDAGGQASAGCRSDQECLADDGSYIGMYCGTPFDDIVCGQPPVEECYIHENCPGETLCQQFFDNCSAGGVGRRCDSSCIDYPEMCSENGGDFVCDPDGACVGQSCLDGYACHAVQFCDPEAEEADVHGCSFVGCQADGVCEPDLFCVRSRCLDALGACTEMSMVP